MRAVLVSSRGPVEDLPLTVTEAPEPIPTGSEVVVDVEVCGVCRTDLHVLEADLPVAKNPIIPGHQVIGRRRDTGERVGVAWLWSSCGRCRWCVSERENLCDEPTFTGYHKNGGYAESVVARPEFLYPIPETLDAAHTAPLLCAGIIGYRAFKRSGAVPGCKLGLYGFGASAHIVIQIARHYDCRVFVMTRGEKHQRLAANLGAAWVGGAYDLPPERLDAAILFAPAGEIVPVALEALDKGGTLASAGIHLSDIPNLQYQKHLFHEKTLTSVTANTREDGRELLKLAAEIPLRTSVEVFPLERAKEALVKLKTDGIEGAAVLAINS
ncbi:MAG: alcohol dehydrogenase [Fimbriimonadales bacterium]|nr:MAG: alcohol dehydrogenase [Fimbriimonadales bacterium]